MIIHIIFAASAIVYIVGNYLDYRNSLGRGEVNPNYKDANGIFDEEKFKRSKIKEFLFIVGLTVLGEAALSLISPYYYFAGLIAAVPLTIFGIKGMMLSRL